MKEPQDAVPTVPHYAALVFDSTSVYHEGDERSRTHPGHGYPAHTETINTINYIVFKDKAEMEAWVLATETKKPIYSYDKPKPYRILEVKPLTAKLTATVAIN